MHPENFGCYVELVDDSIAKVIGLSGTYSTYRCASHRSCYVERNIAGPVESILGNPDEVVMAVPY